MSKSLIILINHMDSGGCQKIVYDIIKNITYDNVYLVSREGFYLTKINNHNIKIHFIDRNGFKGLLRILQLFFNSLRSGKIVLHTHNRIDIIYKFLIRRSDIHIHTFHSAYLKKNRLMRYINPQISISISKVVQKYLEKYKIDSQLIYNGVDIHKLNAKRVNSKHKDLNLLYVGRLSEEKGVVELIKSLMTIKMPYQLNIIGDGALRSKCERISDDRIKFLGFQASPWVDSESYDLVIIPSFYEGFCLVGLEAISNNIAVIANDLPIFREILFFLPDECFFNIKDQASLEKSLLFYKLNSKIVHDLIDENRNKLMSNFSSNKMIMNYKKIYDKFLL